MNPLDGGAAWASIERDGAGNRARYPHYPPARAATHAAGYSTERLTNGSAMQIFNHMVEHLTEPSALDLVFHALADPTRRAMLARLAEGERTVGELAAPFAGTMTFAGASKHVKTLEAAGLIRREVKGRQHLCRLDADRLAQATAWLAQYRRFWTDRLDTLEALLRADASQGDRP